MVEQEDGLSADKLLDEERRRTDFARRVLDGRLKGVGAGVFSPRSSGGELGEVNGLRSC